METGPNGSSTSRENEHNHSARSRGGWPASAARPHGLGCRPARSSAIRPIPGGRRRMRPDTAVRSSRFTELGQNLSPFSRCLTLCEIDFRSRARECGRRTLEEASGKCALCSLSLDLRNKDSIVADHYVLEDSLQAVRGAALARSCASTLGHVPIVPRTR
jgi:hypothetical protein